ncbi:MAG TPA: HEAT repeat domain-containing protein [Polyangiaceae bacterium]|nr:HEAT repeat domain-containing protein [Polyangiaceae bacterium]
MQPASTSPLPTGSGADIPPEALKPQRVKPITIVIVLGIAALIGVVVWLAVRTEQSKMTDVQRIEEQQNIFVLPEKDQIPRWRKWAADKEADVDLRAEALTQLALLGDDEGIQLSIGALQSPSHKLRGTCAQVLAFYGTPKADAGKPALLAALKEADDSDRRQIVWALVELADAGVFNTALDLYRSGEITTVQRLDGGNAFDPNKIAKLVSLDELAKMAGDQSSAVRQLVAHILSEDANAKWTDTLIKLVEDKDIAVAREAAPGLGKIGDERARKPLVEALRKADKDSRDKFLQALRDGIGGEGLVLALDTVAKDPEATNWFQMRQLFDMMHLLADPRIGDALMKWVEANKPHKHWETEAGIVLAEVGDIRGAELIGRRMNVENKDIYQKEKFWQADAGGHMSRTDRPRVIGSRMLADLAVVNPDKADQLKQWALEPTIKWLTDRPQPHANGLRFMAAVGGGDKSLELMRDWAFPDTELPVEGAQPPFPSEFETAQSALRYIGWMKDEQSFDKLLEQFDRKKDKTMDITQLGLEGAGLAMLGMSLRAVARGAANGLAQWGPRDDDRAPKKLIEFIEDKTWHEEAREAGCEALAWISDDKVMEEVVKKVEKFATGDNPKDQFIGACYAVTLARKPVQSALKMMTDLLTPKLEPTIRIYVGRAIGVAGIEDKPDIEAALFEKLKDPETRTAAALALLMGGSKSTAARTVATYSGKDDAPALNELKDMWFHAFGYWSDEDFNRGALYRYVRNAEGIARVKLGDAPQLWASQRLKAQFDNLQFDNGPHSETRVVLRGRLLKAAREGDAANKKNAIQTLKFMKEQGVLMALKDDKGETGQLAAAAYHELMNPRLAEEEDLSHLKPDKDKKPEPKLDE